MTSADIIGLATLWSQACLDAPQPPHYSEGHQIRIDQARERFVQAVAAMQAENESLRSMKRCVVTGCGYYDGGELSRLQAEKEELRADAERFRRMHRWGLRPHAVTDTVWIEPGRQEQKT